MQALTTTALHRISSVETSANLRGSRLVLTTTEIAWLAGLLEGEGSFSTCKDNVHIQIAMTDRDVILRAHLLLHGNRLEPRQYTRQHKDGRIGTTSWWETRVTGRRAAGWMMTVYPLMGCRRKARIRELLNKWKTNALLRDRKAA